MGYLILRYKIITFAFFILASFFIFSSSASALTCAVKAGACSAGETALLRMQATNNSHAGFVGSSAYNNLICCSEGGVIVGTACGGNYDIFLKLSATDNAHVEKKVFPNYANNACISVNPGSITCTYAAGACPAGSTCLASISADTNAHIGDCAAYSEKVCCGPGAAVCVPNGCNGNCPAGCTVAQDPDCACQGGNGCCGVGCDSATDSDCPIVWYPSPISANTLEGLIGDVTDWVLGIAASIIILFLIIGGIRYITSAGNEEAIRSAKNIIMYSIVGLFIILLSWSILQEIKSVL